MNGAPGTTPNPAPTRDSCSSRTRCATRWKAALQSPRWREGGIDLPAVDVSAARAADGGTVLALVNLDPQRPARVATNLTGAARGLVLTSAQMDAHNTFAQPNALVP